MKIALACISILVLSAGALGQSRATAPGLGHPQRKAILDAVRPTAEADLGQRLKFKVDHLMVAGQWAFVRGVTQRPDGRPVDYSRTQYREAIEAGAFDDWFCALLRKRGGKWQVVSYALGATDVVWEGWDERYGAPAAIFG